MVGREVVKWGVSKGGGGGWSHPPTLEMSGPVSAGPDANIPFQNGTIKYFMLWDPNAPAKFQLNTIKICSQTQSPAT